MRAKKESWAARDDGQFPGLASGDLRVERVFWALGSAEYEYPEDELSLCWDPTSQSLISLKKWKDDPENRLYAVPLLRMVKEWAKKQAEQDRCDHGIEYRLDGK